MMVSYYVSAAVYSERMTEDEFASLLGPDFCSEDGWEAWDVDWGLIEGAGTERHLHWNGHAGAWWDEVGLQKVEDLLELRADVTRIEIRVESEDNNYDDVISARVITREGATTYGQTLLPNTYPAMIAAIRDQRRAGNEHGAWLSVEHLLAAIEKGSML